MSRFVRLGIVGIVYIVAAILLLQSGLAQMSSPEVILAVRRGASVDGVYIMYGMALIGLSLVAGVIAVLVARDSQD